MSASFLTVATRLCAATASLLVIVGCGGSGGGGGSTNETAASMSRVAALGEKIFGDVSLSASGAIACATCHDPDHALAGATLDPVPLGGPNLDESGFRNAPSLRYVGKTPTFSFDSGGAPVGGFNRDGRANSLAEQAARPLLAAHEMANGTAADVTDKLMHAAYADEFRAVFGANIFDDPQVAFDRALVALAQYETGDPDFAPFTSKYDYFLLGKVRLTDAELRGLALFNDPEKGNCAACHPSGRGPNGEAPLFTDFSYDNLGVPRNDAIRANDDPSYFDLGLCGPAREDLATSRDLCGAFKVPTLRNVAVTAPYFHNGRFATLAELVKFYVRRDTNPEEWYPLDAAGQVQKFNDLPAEYAANVNVTEVPYNRGVGDTPALSPAEIADVIAFLETLTDGFQP